MHVIFAFTHSCVETPGINRFISTFGHLSSSVPQSAGYKILSRKRFSCSPLCYWEPPSLLGMSGGLEHTAARWMQREGICSTHLLIFHKVLSVWALGLLLLPSLPHRDPVMELLPLRKKRLVSDQPKNIFSGMPLPVAVTPDVSMLAPGKKLTTQTQTP